MRRNAVVFDRPPLFSDEADFQAQLVSAAKRMGWSLVYHTRFSMQSEPGFPDLVLVNTRQGRVLFVELKRDREDPTTAQATWLAALSACRQEAYCWKFADWNRALVILAPRKGLPP
jgi:hypothetical protein